jgi:predicted RNase H-like HicB family nuclease
MAGDLPDRIELVRSDEDGGYMADVPDFTYCSAYGRTPEEALAQLRIAWSLVTEEEKRRHERA